MKCDYCDNEATTREWIKGKSGQQAEKHLCEECARKQGVAPQPQQQQIQQLITQLIGSAKTPPQHAVLNPTVQVGACTACGTTYAQFRHSGLLGCPECYKAFESQLGPLLQRAHEGGTHHTGKVPRLAAGAPAPAPAAPRAAPMASSMPPPAPSPLTDGMRLEKIRRLREQLTQTIAAEQYERAATIRDEIAKIEAGLSRPPSAPPSPPASSPGGKPAT